MGKILFGNQGVAFNSKLLLFGEYALLRNGMGLSVPFDRFSGHLDFDTDGSHQESTAEIVKFHNHLKNEARIRRLRFAFDLDGLSSDLQGGLYFNSNIPQQYGVGSSGAMVAALFKRYATVPEPENQLSLEWLKADFALLESYFHGQSSGTDPLISYLNRPMLIGGQMQIKPVDFDLQQSALSVALLDTHSTGATGPLVMHFNGLFEDAKFETDFRTQMIPANNGCIEAMLKGDHQLFFSALEQLICFELQYFKRMIPEAFQSLILEALGEKVFIKLLGSGGGGFLLVFAETGQILNDWAEKRDAELLFVTKKMNG